jgi:hypothetical protein
MDSDRRVSGKSAIVFIWEVTRITPEEMLKPIRIAIRSRKEATSAAGAIPARQSGPAADTVISGTSASCIRCPLVEAI